MKKFITLFLVASQGFSQNTDCRFSLGNYHYNLQLIINETTTVDFDKADFLNYLEINSSILTSDVQFLNDHMIELFRKYPNTNIEAKKGFYM